MPHKPVYREDKDTSKLMIVFDASSSVRGHTSLNDHFSPVDNLVANLVQMLLRFRSKKIPITANIETAFLQIAIAEEDRGSHRFLWYQEKPTANCKFLLVQEYRMARVTFGATSSPYLLTATINHHLDKYSTQLEEICVKLKD